MGIGHQFAAQLAFKNEDVLPANFTTNALTLSIHKVNPITRIERLCLNFVLF